MRAGAWLTVPNAIDWGGIRRMVSAVRQRAQWLRVTAFAVLALGIVGGGEVYRAGFLSPDVMDDPAMLGYNRPELRQMRVLYGRQGAMIEELFDTLKRPKTQAAIILVASVLVASGCWYFAKLLDHDGKP